MNMSHVSDPEVKRIREELRLAELRIEDFEKRSRRDSALELYLKSLEYKKKFRERLKINEKK